MENSSTRNTMFPKSTENNESCSNVSSDCDQGPQQSRWRKKDHNSLNQFHPSISGYYPFYPPPWSTMNYLYLDLLRHLSLESELRSSLPNIDGMFDRNLLSNQTKKNVARGKFRQQNKKCGNFYTNNEDCRVCCSHVCTTCTQRLRCSSCSHPVLEERVHMAMNGVPPCKCCQYFSDSCPTLHDIKQGNPYLCHHICQKQKQPYHSVSQSTCGYLDHIPIDIPVRESPEISKNTRKLKKNRKETISVLCNEADFHSNPEEVLSEKPYGLEKALKGKVTDKNQSTQTLQELNEDVKKNNSDSDSEHLTNYFRGTGDELATKTATKIPLKPTRKPRPQSTAYFLPISSLNTSNQ